MKVLLYNLIFTLNDKTFCYCKLVKNLINEKLYKKSLLI